MSQNGRFDSVRLVVRYGLKQRQVGIRKSFVRESSHGPLDVCSCVGVAEDLVTAVVHDVLMVVKLFGELV
jgi:hypothetical protein